MSENNEGKHCGEHGSGCVQCVGNKAFKSQPPTEPHFDKSEYKRLAPQVKKIMQEEGRIPTPDQEQGSVPNPGSDKALDQGCTCAVLDNGHGNEELGRIRGFWITGGCPLHDLSQPTSSQEEGEKL